MIWATVSSRSCFYWLYRAFPSLATKNIINLISVLTIWWCPCVELSLGFVGERVFAMTSVFSWQNSNPIFACHSEYIFTSHFCIPIPYGHHFLVLVQECVISSVQSRSHVWLFVIPWITARQASLSITNSRSLPKLMSIESMMPSNHLILCHCLLLLPPIPPSIRVFSNESTLCMRWPKYWSFSISISHSNEHINNTLPNTLGSLWPS